MPRPCTCDRGAAGDFAPGACHPCWLYRHSDYHRRLWGGEPLPPRPAGGPGTELKALLASLGLTPPGGCGCDDLAARMDAWGVAGCRERREDILARLRANAAKVGWLAKLKAGALAVAVGLAFRLDPRDPYPGLLDEAIRRAEAKAPP